MAEIQWKTRILEERKPKLLRDHSYGIEITKHMTRVMLEKVAVSQELKLFL